VSILDIRVLGDPILRQSTVPVQEITDELRTLVADMFETMHHARGIGWPRLRSAAPSGSR
jgi:peptide deformylase